MNAIENYQNLKKQLEAVNQVSNFTLSQVDNKNWNGPEAQFIVNGTNGLFVTSMIEWVKNDPVDIVNKIKEFMATQVNEALLAAEAEAKNFTEVILPVETEYLANKAYVIVPVVPVVPVVEPIVIKEEPIV